ncbi:probable disease resistance protein RF9 isoform X2 [Salvia hispanica]|uniref:probable disease resistance protein RF9 isoform X2 n=1 Tax=Salvia hispanica TaxID=49212 RepID=UPI00200955FA|nr:probable disease resistance protein RF9 isoform X2 [Salvia hispanica]
MEVLASVVELLGEVLLHKINFLRSVREKVELLKDELKRIQCYLKDANQKQADNEGIRNWISEIREVSHDSRDVIEMFILKIESKSRLGKFSSFPKHMHYVNKVGKEIDVLHHRLEAIHRSRESYGIRHLEDEADSVSRSGSKVESWRRMPIWQKDEHLVGMGGDMRKLLQESILDEKSEGLSVAVIDGMAGIGKSTLARKVYNVVSGRFDCRCWVVVSSGFDLRETTKQLIMQLPKSARLRDEIRKIEESTKDERYLLEKLQEMLHEQLKGKTYFIVLDDVWEKEHWESMRYTFPNEQDKPSRLLITTRNKTIANYGDYALEMKVLDRVESWELFVKKAFIHTERSQPQCPEELEPIGREIVKKCNGLPLAITVVGGLLVEPHTKRRWEEVLEQVNSHHRREESRVSTILELSYQNLSHQLKSCFMCLACFKEDADIPTKRLIHIWVGHGLIRHEGRRTVDEIARDYLDELINRNMVQIKDLTLDGRVKNCHLHDLFREVCLEKAKEELGFQIIEKGEKEEAMTRTTKPRHRIIYGQNLDRLWRDQTSHLRSLFVTNSDSDSDLDRLSRDQTRHLRSLFLINSYSDGFNNHGVNTPYRFWKSFQLLEILYLEGVCWRSFPHSFRSLIGLRYLRIQSGSAEKIHIPSWFGHLEKLEVLNAASENLVLPHTTPVMERLRHFSAARVHRLTTMENLKRIETLKYISVDDLLRCTSPSTLPVRELGLFLDQKKEGNVLKRARVSMEEMANLVKLELMWDLSLSIEPAMIPHLEGLTKLKLRGRMRRCPDPSVFPPNLTDLTLVEMFLEEDPMTELGKLLKLEYLKLTGYACLGERMRVLRGGFLSLKGLSIKGMYFLKGIDVEEGGMPQLKLLKIRLCPALKTTNLPQRILASLSST